MTTNICHPQQTTLEHLMVPSEFFKPHLQYSSTFVAIPPQSQRMFRAHDGSICIVYRYIYANKTGGFFVDGKCYFVELWGLSDYRNILYVIYIYGYHNYIPIWWFPARHGGTPKIARFCFCQGKSHRSIAGGWLGVPRHDETETSIDRIDGSDGKHPQWLFRWERRTLLEQRRVDTALRGLPSGKYGAEARKAAKVGVEKTTWIYIKSLIDR